MIATPHTYQETMKVASLLLRMGVFADNGYGNYAHVLYKMYAVKAEVFFLN